MQEWGEANGVEVEYVALPGSDYATKVATAVEAGDVPDVVMMLRTSPSSTPSRTGWST